jgi:myo-inositol-1(or 4)-monophosphatase
VDPLDGTTNFARKIPIWGISLSLLYRGWPVFGYVAIPPLRESFYGFWPGETGLDLTPRAVHRTLTASGLVKEEPLQALPGSTDLSPNHLFSFCTRSIHQLQLPPDAPPFPCKIRMLGVATYNLLTIANGMCVGGIEATPKVWDIAATWVICQAAGATWTFLKTAPFPLQAQGDYHHLSYPTLVLAQSAWEPHFRPYLRH